MRRFCLKLSVCSALVALLASLACLVVYGVTGGKYARYSYQKGFAYQLRALERADRDRPKVILLGGSCLTFGVDMPEFSRLTGMPSYMLGVHGNMGKMFTLECAERFVRKGDVLVYVLAPARHDDFGMPLIYQTLDGEDDWMLDFFLRHPLVVAGTFPIECAHRARILLQWRMGLRPWPFDWISLYHESSFDRRTGYLRYSRGCAYKKGDHPRSVRFAHGEVPAETFEILNAFDACCKARGARLLIPFPPYVDDVLIPSGERLDENLADFEAYVRSNLTASVISSQKTRIYPIAMMHDRPRHLNDEGALDYTRKLVEDLKRCGALSPGPAPTPSR